MTPAGSPEVDAAIVAAFRRGDDDAFGRISRRHFRELHIHCYRMVGSFDEAEDLVQETLLRAWRNRDTYEGRAPIRAWLYRIATNACIDAIRSRPGSAPIEDSGVPRYSQFPWLQPYPDALLETIEGNDDQPDVRLVARETIELAFLATIQLLPAKQRAVFILREVLGFSATETAEVLEDTPAAVNSALQRARVTVRRRASTDPSQPEPPTTFGDVVFLQVYMDASERGDIDAIVDLLREDVRMTLFPDGLTWDGRDEVACEFFKRKDDLGDIRSVAIAANRQPAVAVYRRHSDDTEYRAWAIVLLGVLDGKLREIATFASPDLFVRFGLPPTLPEHRPLAP
jgi:RNA polymerase sigma-70 factor (TIGR02960 family)